MIIDVSYLDSPVEKSGQYGEVKAMYPDHVALVEDLHNLINARNTYIYRTTEKAIDYHIAYHIEHYINSGNSYRTSHNPTPVSNKHNKNQPSILYQKPTLASNSIYTMYRRYRS